MTRPTLRPIQSTTQSLINMRPDERRPIRRKCRRVLTRRRIPNRRSPNDLVLKNEKFGGHGKLKLTPVGIVLRVDARLYGFPCEPCRRKHKTSGDGRAENSGYSNCDFA